MHSSKPSLSNRWPLTSLLTRRLTRRDFLSATAASILASYALLKIPTPAAAAYADKGMPRAGELTHLDASDPAGIDLYIDRQNIKIANGVGSAITVNGSVPGPVIHMKEGKDVLIRVHNRMDESSSIHWHGLLLPFTCMACSWNCTQAGIFKPIHASIRSMFSLPSC